MYDFEARWETLNMTCREKFAAEYPGLIPPEEIEMTAYCPSDYGYLENPVGCCGLGCSKCWDREIPEKEY